jgi:hypothetical protein
MCQQDLQIAADWLLLVAPNCSVFQGAFITATLFCGYTE